MRQPVATASKATTHTTCARVQSEDSESELFNYAESVVSRGSDRDLNVNTEKSRSGFLDKPDSTVLIKLKWLHMNQNQQYVMAPLSFNQLNFPQFVGGEVQTILKTDDAQECYGRLQILSKVAYLYEQCRSWEKARSAYFAMISSIEEGESSWDSSFGHYDMMCPAPQVEEGRSEQKSFKSRTTVKKEFYCKEFQKGECSDIPPSGLDKKCI